MEPDSRGEAQGVEVKGLQQQQRQRSVNKISDSLCAAQYAASLACLTDNLGQKGNCEEHFGRYKECKKMEREQRLEENKKKKIFF